MSINVDALNDQLVQADDLWSAYQVARDLKPGALRDLCDLLYIEIPDEPRKATMALLVAVESRGATRQEVHELYGRVGRRVPERVLAGAF